jgi:predicted ATPase
MTIYGGDCQSYGTSTSYPLPDNDLTRPLDAKVRKPSLEAMLVDCLTFQARKGSVILVLEDCHWLDPLSHELIEVIGRAIVNLPVLMLIIYRPPDAQRLQAPRVRLLPRFKPVTLGEFTLEDTRRLIRLKLARSVAGHHPGAVAAFTRPRQGAGRVARPLSRARWFPMNLSDFTAG